MSLNFLPVVSEKHAARVFRVYLRISFSTFSFTCPYKPCHMSPFHFEPEDGVGTFLWDTCIHLHWHMSQPRKP